MERLPGHIHVIFAARHLSRNDILIGISEGYIRVFAIFRASIATKHSTKNTSSTIIVEDIMLTTIIIHVLLRHRLASNNSNRKVFIISYLLSVCMYLSTSIIYLHTVIYKQWKKVQFEMYCRPIAFFSLPNWGCSPLFEQAPGYPKHTSFESFF